MTDDKKWFFNLTPLSHKNYMTFGDNKKGKVLDTGIIKVNDFFTLNDVALVDRLRYNMISVSQLVDADLSVLFTNQILKFLILLANVCVSSLALEIFFKLIFFLAQSYLRCLSVPCRSGTPIYKSQVKTSCRACIHTLPHAIWLRTSPPN
jgi:hypothetical protein